MSSSRRMVRYETRPSETRAVFFCKGSAGSRLPRSAIRRTETDVSAGNKAEIIAMPSAIFSDAPDEPFYYKNVAGSPTNQKGNNANQRGRQELPLANE